MVQNCVVMCAGIAIVWVLCVACAAGASSPACTAETSASTVTLATVSGATAASVATGDFDGDGVADVAVAYSSGGQLRWFPTGAPSSGTVVRSGDVVYAVAAGDVDGDGDVDLVAAYGAPASPIVRWHSNTDGAGSFSSAGVTVTSDPAVDEVSHINLADVDGSGSLDAVVTGSESDKLFWISNAGGGAFPGPATVIDSFLWNPVWASTADLDGDGDLDVLAAARVASALFWYQSSSGGLAWAKHTIAAGAAAGQDTPESIVAGDVDGDGAVDAVAGSSVDHMVAWYRNTDGAGTFGLRQIVWTGATGVVTVAALDMDGDGDIDLVSGGSSGALWYRNLGGGVFDAPNAVWDSTSVSALAVGNLTSGTAPAIVYCSGTTLRVASQAEPSPSFGSIQSISEIHDGAYHVTVADMDADGDLDLVVASDQDDTVAVYHNTDGVGAFGSPVFLTTSADMVRSTDVGDLDGDGDLDVVAASDRDNTVAWFENLDGVAGSFGPAFEITTSGGGPAAVIVRDMDQDGVLDVVFVGRQVDRMTFCRNTDGRGRSWDLTIVTSLADYVHGLHAVDLDNDGDLDLMTASAIDDEVAWYENLGGGSFGPQTVVASSVDFAQSVSSGDFDGDGFEDIVATGPNHGSVVWFPSGGTASFSPETTVGTLSSAAFVDGVDLDADSRVDVVATSYNAVGWFRNTDGAGTFAGFASIASSLSFVRMARAADIDGDGDLDLVFAESGADRVSWVQHLVRGPFQTYGPVTRGLALHSRFCDVPSSFACVQASLTAMSPCATDTLVLDSGTYGCRTDAHATVKTPMMISARVPGTVTFNCTASEAGGLGAVLFRTESALELRGVNVVGGGVAAGGALTSSSVLRADTSGASLTLADGVVSGCSVAAVPGVVLVQEGLGGAVVAVSGATFLASNVTFAGNSASAAGGAVYAATAQLDGVTFDGNVAGGDGGALAVVSAATLESVTFVGNSAGRHGGGLVLELGSRVEANSSSWQDNAAGESGGAAALLDASTLVMGAGCVVASNTARGSGDLAGGGALAIAGAAAHAAVLSGQQTTMSSNTALHGSGGAVLVVGSGSSFSASACTMEDNVAGVVGGGVAIGVADAAASVVMGPGSVMRSNTAGLGASVAAVASPAMLTGGASLSSIHVSSASVLVPSSPVVVFESGSVLDSGVSQLEVDVFVCESSVDASAAADGGGGGREFRSLVCAAAAPGPPPSAWVTPPAGALGDVRVTPPVSMVPPPLDKLGSMSGTQLGSSAVVELYDGYGAPILFGTYVVDVSVASAMAASTRLTGIEAGVQVDARTGTASLSLATLEAGLGLLRGALDSGGHGAAVGLELRVRGSAEAGLPQATLWVNVTMCQSGWGVSGGGNEQQGYVACSPCDLGSTSSGWNLEPCAPLGGCPDNTVRTGNGTSVCECKATFWSPSGRTNVACVPCPTGGTCAGGTARPAAAPGFFPDPTNEAGFLSCPEPRACLGAGKCRTGYQSRLCAECSDGYYRLSGRCRKCDEGKNVTVAVLLVVVFVIVLGVLLAFNLAESMRYKFAAVMIGLNGLQISAMYGELELDWGGFARAYFDVASALNLNFELTSPECSVSNGTDTWVLKWALTLALPAFAWVGLVCLAPVMLLARRADNVSHAVAGVGRTAFQVLVLLYLPVAAAAFAPLGCHKDASGRWVMAADPVRSCYTSAWWRGLFPTAVVAIGVYAVGIPAAVVTLLALKRRKLDAVTFVLRYGFLVGRFKDSAWWYEAAIMGRKVGVLLCMTFFVQDGSKAAAGVLVLVGSGGHLVWMQPYGAGLHNVLAGVVLGATSLILYSGTVTEYAVRRTGVTVGVVVSIVAIVVGNVLDLLRLARDEAESDATFDSKTGPLTALDDTFDDDSVHMQGIGASTQLSIVGDVDSGGGGSGSVAFVSSV